MNAMLTKYLKDFSAPPPDAEKLIIDSLDDQPGLGMDFSFVAPEPEIDLEAERKEAFDEGYQEATRVLDSEHQSEIQALLQRHEQELAALAAAHEQDVVSKIHRRYQDMSNELAQTLAEQTLQVLLPVLSADMADRAVDRLYGMVKSALTEREVTTLLVRGNASLYATLKPMLDADGVASRLIESDTIDLYVEIEEMVLVTRLETWAQALSEVTE